MNELVKINYSGGDRPTVSGRELHRALQIRLRLDGRYRVSVLSDTVRAAEEEDGITLVISTENSRGKTHLITLKL